MKEYEAILEIINQCPLNRDRDTFFEEIKTDDLDGSVIFDLMVSGIHQRYTFTEI